MIDRKTAAVLVSTSLALAAVSELFAQESAPGAGDWPRHARDAAATRFSPLTQIDTSNVARLERAWTFHTGDLFTEENLKSRNVFQCTPLVVEGKMFVITPLCRAIALDPATGKEIWSFDPKMDPRSAGAARGLAFWNSGGESRIILPVRDGRIFSIDAKTGKPDPSFGDNGFISLRKLYPDAASDIVISSPPSVFRDLFIQGCSLSDSWHKVAPAPLTAFDVRTGRVVWTFNTIPAAADEFGADTWANESWLGRGGANVWSTTSIDEERGIIYLPATAANFDFYGGDRHGANLFSCSVVALDAATGKRLWHYQTIHHDLWDYDLPAAPVLADITVAGRRIPALAQIGKTGFVYVLNRVTGEPVWPIEEHPVPVSDVPGEQAWPTQPFPTKPPPFSPQRLTEENLSQISSTSREDGLALINQYRNEGLFTPPSLRGSVVFPGFHGGGNWSGAALDPRTGRLYINSTEVACAVVLVQNDNSPFGFKHTGWLRLRDREGYPINAPPWGQLTAIDLNQGELVWQKPLGEFEELTERGIPPTGQENFGGATVTAGGLVFIASTMDEHLRAFDAETGEILFKVKLDAAGYAAPVSYEIGGRQYIAICAGGGGKLGTEPGDSVIAFALPE
jgi:quinoprotein glucose dehydrogenase